MKKLTAEEFAEKVMLEVYVPNTSINAWWDFE